MTTLWILLGCALCIGVILGVWVWLQPHYSRAEGFQSAVNNTKPAWLDATLWTPLNRTRFGWTNFTPSAWFQYDTVNLAGTDPIYDADVAAVALESNGNDPIKAREALKTKLMDYIDITIRRGTTPAEITPYTPGQETTDETTRPAAIFAAMWTPLHRVMWGVKDGDFDAIEYDLVRRRGETLATADLKALTERQTMRTFPSDVAKRALDMYDQDVYVARQRLLAGSAFETGASAYADISGTLFKDYGILMTRPATIAEAQWTTLNRTMYPVVQKPGAATGTVKHEYDRAPAATTQLVPLETAQYMLSLTGDDPVEARYKYLKDRATYDAKLVTEKERQKLTSLETIKAKSCAELDKVYDTLEAAKRGLRPTIQDLSGSALTAAGLKDENMRFQKRFFQDCSGTTGASTGPCMDLATQDEGLFSLYTEYELTNTDLFSREIEVLEAIEIVTNTMKLLQCPNAKTLSYSVEKDIGYIDTETLFIKLSELSPYYISPVIVRALSSAITDTISSSGAADLDGSMGVIKTRMGAIKSMAGPYTS